MGILDHIVPGYDTVVRGIQFGVPDRHDIKKGSVCEVNTQSLYLRGLPVAGSINDLRMGTTDRRHRCKTCWNTIVNCSGHSGYLDLGVPVLHGAYVDIVIKIMRTLCYFCGKPKAVIDSVKDYRGGKFQFTACYNHCKSRKTCIHCGMQCPMFAKNGNSLTISWSSGQSTEHAAPEFSIPYIRQILRSVDEATWEQLGFDWSFARPDSLVIDRVTVPTPVIRPAIMNDSRSRGQDDLTHCLQDINRQAVHIKTLHDAGQTILDKIVDDASEFDAGSLLTTKLQNAVCSLCNNQKADNRATQRSGAPLKTLKDRLTGKEGLLRGNMLGKRTNHSARSVISPDPRLEIFEVGVPEHMCRELTIPVAVTVANMEALTTCVRKGPGVLGGAAVVISRDGAEIDLQHCLMRESIRLRADGDVVERYIQEGDPVIFNRQPSLHVGSMMCHRVKIIYNTSKEIVQTFRLNPITASPYNADFDGDEMNLHVPQSIAAMVEMVELMSVQKQIISPQNNKPMMGLVQDSLTGIYMLTDPDLYLDRACAMQLLGSARNVWKTKPMSLPDATSARGWSGIQLVSQIMPPINIDRGSLQIRKGQILSGRLDKSNIGKTSGSIIHVVACDLGNQCAAEFMSDVQNMVDCFLMEFFGLSCGISDCIPDEQTTRDVKKIQHDILSHIDQINETVDGADTIDEDEREMSILKVASNALSSCGQVVLKSLGDTNNIYRMVTSGAKGNIINLTQIMACVSQSCVQGCRVLPRSGSTRVFPSIDHNSRSPEDFGFICTPYHLGLQPTEFFFHMMGGREGLVDTAVKTSVTGYMQRRLIKFSENLTVVHTKNNQKAAHVMVMNADDHVVSFHYGGDGFNPRCLERVSEPSLTWPDERVFEGMIQQEIDIIAPLRRKVCESMEKSCSSPIDPEFHLPFNVQRLLLYFNAAEPPGGPALTDNQMVDLIHELVDREICSVYGAAPTLHVVYHLLFNFTCAKLRRLEIAHKDQITDLFGLVCAKLRGAVSVPGTMVGCLGSQSIGENLTQLTLNTFHLCLGQVSGVGRIKEIVDASKKMECPSCSAKIDPTSPELEEVVHSSAQCNLTDCVERSWSYIREPNLDDIVARLSRIRGTDPDFDTGVGLVLVLRQKFCQMHFIRFLDIFLAVQQYTSGVFEVQGTSELSDTWILQLKLNRNVVPHIHAEQTLSEVLNFLLHHIEISGLPGLENVVLHPSQTDDSPSASFFGEIFQGMRALDCCDFNKTYCNNFIEVQESLGIEAANTCLLTELHACLSQDGTYINIRHLCTIVDLMTSNGAVTPVSRHGVNQSASQPLQRASFEETFEVICDAAVFGYRDFMGGVSATMMMGLKPPIGTNFSEIMSKPNLGTLSRRALQRSRKHARNRSPRRSGAKKMMPLSKPEWKPERMPATSTSFFDNADKLDEPNPFVTETFANDESAASFAPDSAIAFESQSPGYMPESPTYMPESPTYMPESPTYMPESPTYMPKSPTYMPKSPGYTQYNAQVNPAGASRDAFSPPFLPSSDLRDRSLSGPAIKLGEVGMAADSDIDSTIFGDQSSAVQTPFKQEKHVPFYLPSQID
jgi:DNA-directed RNA polymerase II subunit RPB1